MQVSPVAPSLNMGTQAQLLARCARAVHGMQP